MLSLPLLNKELLDIHETKLYSKVEKALVVSKLPLNAKKFLNESNIKLLLRSKPEDLFELHTAYIKALGRWYSLCDYNISGQMYMLV